MVEKINLGCEFCGKKIEVRLAEYRRQAKKGREHFFCNLSCAARYRNARSPGRKVEVEKKCPHCKRKFKTLTGSKSKTFCSRSCASAGSVTPKRREAARKAGGNNSQNLIGQAKVLKLRESWKYKKLIEFLDYLGIDHEFEYEIVPGTIFDLAILDGRQLFIEFDGKYHQDTKTKKRDLEKTKAAAKEGWGVERVEVQDNSVIDPSVLYGVLN